MWKYKINKQKKPQKKNNLLICPVFWIWWKMKQTFSHIISIGIKCEGKNKTSQRNDGDGFLSLYHVPVIHDVIKANTSIIWVWDASLSPPSEAQEHFNIDAVTIKILIRCSKWQKIMRWTYNDKKTLNVPWHFIFPQFKIHFLTWDKFLTEIDIVTEHKALQ